MGLFTNAEPRDLPSPGTFRTQQIAEFRTTSDLGFQSAEPARGFAYSRLGKGGFAGTHYASRVDERMQHGVFAGTSAKYFPLHYGRSGNGMSLIGAIYSQFRQPRGAPGRVAGWIMANRPSNIERSRWTVGLLKLQPTDHVLEIGFGPGLAIQEAARLVPAGRVVGIDHSALMVKQAGRRNQAAVEAGLVDLRLGGFELLPRLGEAFDKIFSVNVLQFLPDRSEVLRLIRSVLRSEGLAATTVQLRHRGATAADAHAFGRQLSRELEDAGFREVTVEALDLEPVPAVCVLARA